MKPSILVRCWPLLLAAGLPVPAQAATPAELLAAYTAQAARPASAERGHKLFNTTSLSSPFGWSCASCHGSTPTQAGRHALSEKKIEPLAPAANPKRFTDRAHVDGHFRLNCKDVFNRECTAAEKADVLSWLLTLKP